MEILEAAIVQAFRQPRREAHRIAIDHAVVAVGCGNAQAHAVAAPDGGDGLDDFEDEPGAIFQRAAIGPERWLDPSRRNSSNRYPCKYHSSLMFML